MAHEIPIAALARARSAFEGVLDGAVPAYELGQLGLFTDDSEAYIKKEVERKLYDPKLPNAGDRERKWIDRLEKLAALREWSGSKRAFRAAAVLKTLLPTEYGRPGRYYIRTPLTIRNGKAEYEWLRDLRDIAESEKQWDRKWFADLLLGGLPEEVSNFRIECLYLLKMPDGTTERRVRLVNVLGEKSGEINLDAKAFCSPEKFREWCLAKGNFAWSGNQTALHSLHLDICAEAAWNVINLVVTMGWYPLSDKPKAGTDGKELPMLDGVYFMGDCAYRNGQRLEMNNGCYWITMKDDEGNDLPPEGFQIADVGRENPFFHKKPRLNPQVRVTDVKIRFDPHFDFPASPDNKDQLVGLPAKPSEAILMARFFRELCCRLKNVCGEAANLIIGSVLSYAAAAEVFYRYGQFSGLWLHGSQNSGKSTVLDWMMEIWGFVNLRNGIILRGNNSTPTGLLQAADQYSNLPIWLDEFRSLEVGEDKKAVIHNFFNRGGQAKFSMTKLQRSIRTNALISGESTTGDPALRSRFPHIQIARAMRTGSDKEQKENYEWFCDHREHFRLFGLWLLEHRNEFAAKLLDQLEKWDEPDMRLKIAQGVGYSAWKSMWILLSQEADYAAVFTEDESRAFRQFILDHSAHANEDVVSETNINLFWTDLLTAVKSNAIPAYCFRLEMDGLDSPPGCERDADGRMIQGPWKSYRIYVEPDGTLAALQKELVKQRTGIALRRKDYRDQLSKELYWLGSGIRKRFTSGTAGGVPAWGIAVDKHPLGYMQVSDEEFLKYRANRADGDPRKGPLFELVDWIKDHEEEKAKQETSDAIL